MKLETHRLIIRPISLTDKHEIFAYRCDAETNRYQGWVPKTVQDVEAFIQKVSKQVNVPETWFQCAILKKESQKIIGDVGIHFFDRDNKQAGIGCTLNKAYHNRGYATESLSSIIDYLFSELHKHRLIVSIDPENKASIRLVERLGFRKEAHFIESILVNGKWVDDIVYALLRADWAS